MHQRTLKFIIIGLAIILIISLSINFLFITGKIEMPLSPRQIEEIAAQILAASQDRASQVPMSTTEVPASTIPASAQEDVNLRKFAFATVIVAYGSIGLYFVYVIASYYFWGC